MVVICENIYKKELDTSMFSFPLSSFQKYAIEGIIQDKHVLICVPTGNGKTLPAEFAIKYFVSKGKKVIYTSPIKSLSNQKYYDFKEKYPDIQFGLLTGDIKLNPNADVLIMTAEILQNSLLHKDKSFSTFEMDYNNDLACVIHDEVHSIGLQDRGYVWENIFMLLPPHVQNVMLSATLDKPEQFAEWVEDIHKSKEVYLISLKERAVPLFHYSFITCNEGFFKKLKDKVLEQEIREVINKPIILKENSSLFNELNYRKINKVLKVISQKELGIVKRHYVLNKVCKYLLDNDMLPCACFILSRKQLEIAAREITIPLLEDDSKTPYIIKNKCERMLRDKLTNYDEFIELPEYISMISLLEKGIATHHSGTLPILKEIVEILFVEGFIKLLFCTETFSCGLNMPIKTTIFTDINKFDGRDFRLLYGYEYNQASGRAGRRGLDKKGYVVHLNNLFKSEVNVANYKNMMAGNPQKLNSHYKISYHLLFSNFSFSLEKSLIQKEIDNENHSCEIECLEKEKERERIEKSLVYLKTPLEDIKKYMNINSLIKKKKEDVRIVSSLKEKYYTIEEDCKVYLKINKIDEEIENIKKSRETNKYFLYNKMKIINDFLIKEGFITTTKINLAKCFKEVPCLVFSDLIYNMGSLSVIDIAMILSCYTNIHISSEEKRCIKRPNIISLNKIMDMIEINSDKYLLFENNNNIDTGETYDIQYDLMGYVEKWIEAENVEECKYVLYLLLEEKGLFLGEFVKAMLKIIAICNEIINACELINDFSLMEKIKIIIYKIQKYVVSNQSLYI
jgi:ATP-dependent RNA helicase DOB1